MKTNSSSAESDTEDNRETKKMKKGVRNVDTYKMEVIKRSRLLGSEYVNTKGNVVSKKSNTNKNCDCKEQCTSKLSFEEKLAMFTEFYDGKSKNQQDQYLMGLIDACEIKRRRTKVADRKNRRDYTFTYFCKVGCKKQRVCRDAFLILHVITKKANYRLTNLVVKGASPNDARGKHANRGNSLPIDIVNKIDQHILSFPCKQSHYSSKLIKYLDCDLNIFKMHELFCEKFPTLKVYMKRP